MNGETDIASQTTTFKILKPKMGSVFLSTRSKLPIHNIPEHTYDILTIVKRQTEGAILLFK